MYKNKLNKLIILSILVISITSTTTNMTVKAEDTLIATFDVPSDGTPVTSPALEAGKTYKVVATEMFWYDKPNWKEADAQYYQIGNKGWNWDGYAPAPDGHSFLQIDGMDVDWGPFSNGDTGHTYTTYVNGDGAPLSFSIVDWMDGDYTNNDCHLPVFVYETSSTTPCLTLRKELDGVALVGPRGERIRYRDSTLGLWSYDGSDDPNSPEDGWYITLEIDGTTYIWKVTRTRYLPRLKVRYLKAEPCTPPDCTDFVKPDMVVRVVVTHRHGDINAVLRGTDLIFKSY